MSFKKVYKVYDVHTTTKMNFYRKSSTPLIINSSQITTFYLYDSSPDMSTEHKEYYKKIFDTEFENLGIFEVTFSDNQTHLIIGKKDIINTIH